MANHKYPKGVREHYGKLQIFFKPKGYQNYLYQTISDTVSKNQIIAAGKLRLEIVNKIKFDTFSISDYFPENDHGKPLKEIERSFSFYAQVWASNPAKKWASATRRKNLSILNYLWMPAFHDVVIASIEYTDITTVINKQIVKFKEQFNRDISSSLYNSWVGVIRSVFTEAAKDKQSGILIKDNPTLLFDHMKRDKKLIEQFGLKDMILIIDDIYQHDGKMAGAWFELGFFTGMRYPSEPSALKWSNVDFNHHEIRVVEIRTKSGIQKTTKTGVHRTVKMNERSLNALTVLRELTGFENDYVFLQADGRPVITADPQRKIWKACLRRLGFAYQGPYSMRHSYASFCLMQDMKAAFVCAQLGNSREEFFKTYARWIDSQDDNKEMEKLDSALATTEKKWAKSGRNTTKNIKSKLKQLVSGAKGETRIIK